MVGISRSRLLLLFFSASIGFQLVSYVFHVYLNNFQRKLNEEFYKESKLAQQLNGGTGVNKWLLVAHIRCDKYSYPMTCNFEKPIDVKQIPVMVKESSNTRTQGVLPDTLSVFSTRQIDAVEQPWTTKVDFIHNWSSIMDLFWILSSLNIKIYIMSSIMYSGIKIFNFGSFLIRIFAQLYYCTTYNKVSVKQRSMLLNKFNNLMINKCSHEHLISILSKVTRFFLKLIANNGYLKMALKIRMAYQVIMTNIKQIECVDHKGLEYNWTKDKRPNVKCIKQNLMHYYILTTISNKNGMLY